MNTLADVELGVARCYPLRIANGNVFNRFLKLGQCGRSTRLLERPIVISAIAGQWIGDKEFSADA